jgi:aspartate/methionine/tyrosine aminotransferase
LSGCPRINLAVPQAGTFCWFEVIDAPCDARDLARACAREAGVVVMPGSAFGVDSPTYLRVSFAVPPGELIQGLAALVSFLGNL